MDPELASYIDVRRGQGIPDSIIQQELLSVGWLPEEISPALGITAAQNSSKPGQNIPADTATQPSISSQLIAGLVLGVVLIVLTLLVFGLLEPVLSEAGFEGFSAEERHKVIDNLLFIILMVGGVGSTMLVTKKLNLHPRFWLALDIFVIADYLTILARQVFSNSPAGLLFFALVASTVGTMLISYISSLKIKAINIATTLLCLVGVFLIYKG